jgi:hypothetical protein
MLLLPEVRDDRLLNTIAKPNIYRSVRSLASVQKSETLTFTNLRYAWVMSITPLWYKVSGEATAP